MKNLIRKLLSFSVFIVLIVLNIGCESLVAEAPTSTPQSTLVVTRVVLESLEPSPTPAVCTPLAEGMEFVIEPVSSESVKVQLSGLQSGESLTVLFVAQPTATQKSEIEISLPHIVEPNGRFSYQENGLSALQDATENTWTVKVIHTYGVACQEFTLP